MLNKAFNLIVKTKNNVCVKNSVLKKKFLYSIIYNVWKEQLKWGTGPECTTVLSKPNGQAVSWTTGCHK